MIFQVIQIERYLFFVSDQHSFMVSPFLDIKVTDFFH